MPRHSFIQMSKLPNVKGRISYITSHARQENLYATYRTADSQLDRYHKSRVPKCKESVVG